MQPSVGTASMGSSTGTRVDCLNEGITDSGRAERHGATTRQAPLFHGDCHFRCVALAQTGGCGNMSAYDNLLRQRAGDHGATVFADVLRFLTVGLTIWIFRFSTNEIGMSQSPRFSTGRPIWRLAWSGSKIWMWVSPRCLVHPMLKTWRCVSRRRRSAACLSTSFSLSRYQPNGARIFPR